METLTREDLSDIESFIDLSLDRQWDDYTDRHICRCSNEDGKKSMNPEIYKMMLKIRNILNDSAS